MKKLFCLLFFFALLISGRVYSQTFYITEVAIAEDSSLDWVEIYCADANGLSVELTGFKVKNSSASTKIIGTLTMETGDYLVVNYGTTGNTDENKENDDNTNGYIDIYGPSSGLPATDSGIIFENDSGNVLDAVCWSDYSDPSFTLSSPGLTFYNQAINSGQWSKAGVLTLETDGVQIKTIQSGWSIGVDDTVPATIVNNERKNWSIRTVDSKGSGNGPHPSVDKFQVNLPVMIQHGLGTQIELRALNSDNSLMTYYNGIPDLSVGAGSENFTITGGKAVFVNGIASVGITVEGGDTSGTLNLVVKDDINLIETTKQTTIVQTLPVPTLKITEFTYNGGGGGISEDWIEITCVDDGNSGSGADISNFSVLEENTLLKNIPVGTLIRTGNIILLRLSGGTGTDDNEFTNGLMTLYSSDSGLVGTAAQVILKNASGVLIDSVCYSGPTDMTQTDKDIVTDLISLGQWFDQLPTGGEADADDCVSRDGVSSGYSHVRKWTGVNTFIDNNSKDDWKVTSVPTPGSPNSTGPTPNVTLLISEVAYNGGGGDLSEDWVEVYCVDDLNSGGGANISGYKFYEGSTLRKTIENGTIIKKGEHILLHFNNSSSDNTTSSEDILNIYTTDSGLTGTDEQVAITDHEGNYIDAVCWADGNGEFSDTDIGIVDGLISNSMWVGNTETDSFVTTKVGSGYSIYRKFNTPYTLTDSNQNTDWHWTSVPNPGKKNNTGPAKGVNLIVTEVAYNSGGGGISEDWAEIYCVNDGNGGAGSVIAGYRIFEGSTLRKVLTSETTIKTGEYLILQFNSTMPDEKTSTNGIIKVYTTDSGITGTDEQIIVQDHEEEILDAVCFADNNGDFSDTDAGIIANLVSFNQWAGSLETDSVLTSVNGENLVLSGYSIFRKISNGNYVDTQNKDDWKQTSIPTPGNSNDSGPKPGVSLLITEIAYASGGGGIREDWIEILCVDDKNGGSGSDIGGYQIYEGSVRRKVISQGTTIKTGDYIILQFNDGVTPDETTATNGILKIYVSDSGLTGTDEQVYLIDLEGTYLDAIGWADNNGDFSDTNVNIINKLIYWGMWIGNTETDSVLTRNDTTNLVPTGYSIARDLNESKEYLDTNKNVDWKPTGVPTPGKRNDEGSVADVKLLISEVAPNNGGGSYDDDWIEFYCKDDMSGGTEGSGIGGYSIYVGSSRIKLVSPDTVIKTGQFIILHFNSSLPDQTRAQNNVLHIYTSSSGLVSTDEQIYMIDHQNNYIDALCYSDHNGELSDTDANVLNGLVAQGMWPSAEESSSVNISTLQNGQSIGRSRSFFDSNSIEDWNVFSSPVAGQVNGADVGWFEITWDNENYTYSGGLISFTVKGVDTFGNFVSGSTEKFMVYGSSNLLRFSLDAKTFVSELDTELINGQRKIFVKAENDSAVSGKMPVKLLEKSLFINVPESGSKDNINIFVESETEGILGNFTVMNIYPDYPVTINEVMYKPAEGLDTDHEWIELYNYGTSSIDISGWEITVGTSVNTLPDNSIIPAEGYFVLARKLTGADNVENSFETKWGNINDPNNTWDYGTVDAGDNENYPAVDGSYTLTDGGTIELSNKDKTFISRFTYITDWGGKGNGYTIQKINPKVRETNDIQLDALNWTSYEFNANANNGNMQLSATPGKRNSVYAEPVDNTLKIESVVNSEALVGKPLSITAKVVAKITADYPVVQLYYRKTGDTAFSGPLTLLNRSGTDLFEGNIPDGFVRPEGVEYYVRASNASTIAYFPPASYLQTPVSVEINDYHGKLQIVSFDKRVSHGELFNIDVVLENAIDTTSVSFELEYEALTLEVVDQDENRTGNQIIVGSFMESGFNAVNEENSGIIKFSIEGLKTAVNGKGTIATIQFRVKNKLYIHPNGKSPIVLRAGTQISKKSEVPTDLLLFNGFVEFNASLGSDEIIGTAGGSVTGAVVDEGGTATTKKIAILEIPQGAFKASHRVYLKRLTGREAYDSQVSPMGGIYDYTKLEEGGKKFVARDNHGQGNPICFEIGPGDIPIYKPLSFKIPFESNLGDFNPQVPSDKIEDFLSIYHYSAEEDIWKKIGGTIDKTSNFVTVQVQEWGQYLLVIDTDITARPFFLSELTISPNPFSPGDLDSSNDWLGDGKNDVTKITYRVSETATINIRIYKPNGELVKTIAENETVYPGYDYREWDGTDDFMDFVRTGIYIVSIRGTGDYEKTSKLVKTVVVSKHLRE